MEGVAMKAHFHAGWKHFWKQIFRVLRNPIFFVLTIIGNFTLLLCTGAFYFLERDVNPNVHSFFDSFWWAIITMTTVGYGDIIPVTILGRIITVVLIFTGSVLFLSFIALLASAFVELEFNELEAEVDRLRKDVHRLTEKKF